MAVPRLDSETVDWAIAIGLCIQGAALVLLFRCLGGPWFTHVGAVFIVMAVIYHGVNELLLALIPGRDSFRLLVTPDDFDTFMLWISAAILLLTTTYVIVIRRAAPAPKPATEPEVANLRRVLDWRLMLLISAPLVALTIQGNGYFISPGAISAIRLDTTVGLATQFLLPTLVLTSLGFVLRYGSGWILPVLAVQSAVLAVIGERLEIIVGALLLLYVLVRVGFKIRRSQLAIALAMFMTVAVVVTAARAAEGRILAASDGSIRLSYLVDGLGQIGSANFFDQVAFDLGHRLDGNSFGAMELSAINSGRPPIGITPLINDVVLAVPSFLYPGKLDAPIENFSEREYADLYLGLPLPVFPTGVHQDIIGTQLGGAVGFGGPWVLLLIAVGLGLAFAAADRWVLRRLTPSRFLVGLGLMSCALFYERSWNSYPAAFRGIAVLIVLAWIVGVLQRRAQRSPQVAFARGQP